MVKNSLFSTIRYDTQLCRKNKTTLAVLRHSNHYWEQNVSKDKDTFSVILSLTSADIYTAMVCIEVCKAFSYY